jgi:hypothetical protein
MQLTLPTANIPLILPRSNGSCSNLRARTVLMIEGHLVVLLCQVNILLDCSVLLV